MILALKITNRDLSQSYLYFNNSYDYDYAIYNDTKTVFIKTGPDLNYINYFQVNYESEIQAVNSSSIFCLDRTNNKVWVYTTDLDDTQHHFTENIPTGSAKAMQANNSSLFILHQDFDQMKLRVINIESKTVRREISLPSLSFNQIKLISTGYLIAFDNLNNRLFVIDTEKCIEQVFNHTVCNLEQGLCLSRDGSSFLVFFNDLELKCSFSIENK